jgi:hypothetical protein
MQHVIFNGAFAQEKRSSYRAVRAAIREELEHLKFTVRSRLQDLAGPSSVLQPSLR